MDEDIDGLFSLAPKLAQLGATLNSNWLHERATALAGVPLERPALKILGVLQGSGGPLRIGEIAAEMRVEGPHVTRHVQRLERKGLVHRVTDPQDKRARLIELTPAGADLSTRYRSVVIDWLSQAFMSWPESDKRELVRLGGRMVDDFLDFLKKAEECDPHQADR
ncbi:MarR family winged helix-turn-helix transcriptional regulator [Streptomyces gelaticus]